MKKMIMLTLMACLAVGVACAQHNDRIKRETQSQGIVVGNAQQQVASEKRASVNVNQEKAHQDLMNAQNAVNAAQRNLNELPAIQRKKAEKFAEKLAKIDDPAKRAAEQKKFDEKMRKEMDKAQRDFDKALKVLYKAQENLDRAYSH